MLLLETKDFECQRIQYFAQQMKVIRTKKRRNSSAQISLTKYE